MSVAPQPQPGKEGAAPGPTGPATQDRAAQLAKCKILAKLKAGDLHSITRENVEELFEVLDQNERGELSHHDLKMLQDVRELNMTDDDIQNLLADCDKDSSGKISMDELYKAFTQGSIVHKYVLKALGQGPKVHKTTECNRQVLLDYLIEEHDTKDALWSLPPTLIMFAVYMVCVTWHLDMATAFDMQSGILGELEGEGKPYLGTYVHDVPSFWEWMRTSFVSAQYKSAADKLGDFPQPGRFASFNQILGGMQVVKYASEARECDQSSLLQQAYDTWYGPGRCWKSEPLSDSSIYFLYHQKADETIAHINNLAETIWVSHNTTTLDFTNLYYNGHLQIFTMMHLTFDFLPNGVVRFLFDMESFQADPYRNMIIIGFDIVFGIFILKMFYTEFKEMIQRSLNGLDGFIDYWEFWNVVDWASIIFGVACIALWAMVITQVSGDLQPKIAALPTKLLDEWVLSNETYFTVSELAEVVPHEQYHSLIQDMHTAADSVSSVHATLRSLVFFYSAVLMLKFFKGFRANPRLDVVVQTMVASAPDMAHFGIVFGTIFLVFSMMAYVAFGSKIKQFSTQIRSLLMCWRILLGEWDVDEMDMVSFTFSNIWFVSFQTLVTLILLNMLLAIIMDTYTEVKGMKENPIEIWNQTRQAITHLRERRGHLPMFYLICEMEDEDQKAHPGELVTTKSLRKAFERDKMTRHNAEYLVRSAVEWAKDKEGDCSLSISDSVRLIGQVKTTVMKVQEQGEKSLEILKAQMNAPSTMRQDMIMAGIDPDAPQQKRAPTQPPMHGQAQQGAYGGNPVTGVPINNAVGYPNPGGAMYGNQAPNMMNGMNGMNGAFMQPPMPALQNDQTLPLDNRPFQPDMSFNNHHLGRTVDNSGQGQGNRMGGPQNLGATGPFNNTFGSSTMSSMSPAGGQFGNSFSGNGGSPYGSSHPGSPHGGGNLSNQLAQLQASIDTLQDAVMDQRQYIEQRDSWLEHKMTALDRRCEKVEVLSDRLYMLLRELDVGDLASVPRKVVQALNTHGDNRMGTPERRLRREDDDGGAGTDARADTDGTPPSGGHGGSKLEHDVHHLTQQMTELLAHAQETTELKKLLWSVDLNVRRMNNAPARSNNNTASNLQVDRARAAAMGHQQYLGGAQSQHTGTPADSRRSSHRNTLRLTEMGN